MPKYWMSFYQLRVVSGQEASQRINLLSRDLSLDSEFTGVEILSEKEALDNSFYQQFRLTSQWRMIRLSGDQSGSLVEARFPWRETIISTSTSEVEGFVIGAEDSLSLSGSFSFSTESEKNVRVVMMSGDLLTMEDGSSLSSVVRNGSRCPRMYYSTMCSCKVRGGRDS